MVTDTDCFPVVLLVLLGKSTFSALGLIKVDVIMKKISNRNTMSVMEAMLKLTEILFLEFNATA